MTESDRLKAVMLDYLRECRREVLVVTFRGRAAEAYSEDV
jgi:hypothetical protein